MGCLLLVDIHELRKEHAGQPVLDGVSLQVERGETVVLTGPSGAGKTTLLRCINGLERADTGTVQVAGHQLSPAAPGLKGQEQPRGERERELLAIRRRVGLVFQEWHLFRNLSVLENVMEAPIHVARLPRAESLARARALLERVGIAPRAAAYPDQLSGGEQQRAALARALAMEPDLLLLDEPTSALDAARVDDLLSLLRELPAGDGGKLTMIVVSHDARVPAALGARLIAMAAGRIVHDSDGVHRSNI